MRTFGLCAAVVVLMGSQPASAGMILNAIDGSKLQVNHYEAIGNTFTAEDSAVSAALHLTALNPSFDPSDAITFQLHAGVGTAGELLFSRSVVVDSGYFGFFDVDLSSVDLRVGNEYTFTASIVGTSPYWGLSGSSDANGIGIIRGSAANSRRLALRVTPVAAAVPEPSTLALMVIGPCVAGAGAFRRRKITGSADNYAGG